MKYIVTVVMLCLGISVTASAQDAVYNSSGKPGKAHYKKSKAEGFDPSRLVFGAGAIVAFGTGYANLGLSPIVGYRITDDFSAGIGIGYQYLKQQTYLYTQSISDYKAYNMQANIVYPSVWARYKFFRNFFAEASYEYDMMFYSDYYINSTTYDPTPEKVNINTSSLLVGGGVNQPITDRAAFVIEVLYDVLQQPNTPYFGVPVFRGGIVVGF